MLWRGRRESGNVVDRRGVRTAGAAGGGALLIGLIYLILTGDPGMLLSTATQQVQTPARPSAADDEAAAFVRVVLADTEDVWHEVLGQRGLTYQEPKLVLFNGRVDSACGTASSAVGPFYCPGDGRVYLDLGFFRELEQRLGAGGDFARAYVIAHEVGHHVQNLLGTSQQATGRDASVRLELQADCYAGLWAKETDRVKGTLEPGDVEEAMSAAAAVGDDRLQLQARGYVVPDSFTHGTSAQRVAWFEKGYRGGTLEACDTFGTAR